MELWEVEIDTYISCSSTWNFGIIRWETEIIFWDILLHRKVNPERESCTILWFTYHHLGMAGARVTFSACVWVWFSGGARVSAISNASNGSMRVVEQSRSVFFDNDDLLRVTKSHLEARYALRGKTGRSVPCLHTISVEETDHDWRFHGLLGQWMAPQLRFSVSAGTRHYELGWSSIEQVQACHAR